MDKRRSGILLHITSLPSPYGIGDLGPSAYRFADLLSDTKQSCWQVLPLNPLNAGTSYSPYSSISAFAGNTLLISPEVLVQEKLLSKEDFQPKPQLPRARCHYDEVVAYKKALFEKLYARCKKDIANNAEYRQFCQENRHWLEDFVLFSVLKKLHVKGAWSRWPKDLKERNAQALAGARNKHADGLQKERFLQFIFFKQWNGLKRYCNDKGIKIIGDIPIYVSHDSADVWAHPGIFKLDADRRPSFVAGVPPDYFSKTGQLWGNPVFRWKVLQKKGYDWWVKRIGHNFKMFDMARIDHFRGFVAYWEVAAREKTAVNGKWIPGPADDFFTTMFRHFPKFPIIAEDLGTITDDVRALVKRYKFPGMKVLLFAFGEENPKHPYLPHNYIENCVVYTGTHDNNTAKGWFRQEARPEDRKRVSAYIGRAVTVENIHWELIELALRSKANTAIIPLQDILGLGSKDRMNTPSTVGDNWQWRMGSLAIDTALSQRLRRLTEKCKR